LQITGDCYDILQENSMQKVLLINLKKGSVVYHFYSQLSMPKIAPWHPTTSYPPIFLILGNINM
jgi:hypothetical protein